MGWNIAMSKMYTTHTHTHTVYRQIGMQDNVASVKYLEKRNVFKPPVAQSKGSVYSPTFSAQLFISVAAPAHHSSGMRLPW